MSKYGSYIMSSFHRLRCCDEDAVTEQTLAWRAKQSSLTCVLDGNGKNTGYVNVATLEQYNVSTGALTGQEAPNIGSHPAYIANYPDVVMCPYQTQQTNQSTTYEVTGVEGNGQITLTVMISAIQAGDVDFDIRALCSVNGVSGVTAYEHIVIPAGMLSASFVYNVSGFNNGDVLVYTGYTVKSIIPSLSGGYLPD